MDQTLLEFCPTVLAEDCLSRIICPASPAMVLVCRCSGNREGLAGTCVEIELVTLFATKS